MNRMESLPFEKRGTKMFIIPLPWSRKDLEYLASESKLFDLEMESNTQNYFLVLEDNKITFIGIGSIEGFVAYQIRSRSVILNNAFASDISDVINHGNVGFGGDFSSINDAIKKIFPQKGKCLSDMKLVDYNGQKIKANKEHYFCVEPIVALLSNNPTNRLSEYFKVIKWDDNKNDGNDMELYIRDTMCSNLEKWFVMFCEVLSENKGDKGKSSTWEYITGVAIWIIIICVIVSRCSNGDSKDASSEETSIVVSDSVQEEKVDTEFIEKEDIIEFDSTLYYEDSVVRAGMDEYVSQLNKLYADNGSSQEARWCSLEEVLQKFGYIGLYRYISKFEKEDVTNSYDVKKIVEKGTFLGLNGSYYKLTDSEIDYEYYVGETKKNRPNGKGAIFNVEYGSLSMSFVGEFENGYLKRGLSFSSYGPVSILRQNAKYKKGKETGKVCKYSTSEFINLASRVDAIDNLLERVPNDDELFAFVNKTFKTGDFEPVILKWETRNSSEIHFDQPILICCKSFEGEMKKGSRSGNGTEYDTYGNVSYKGSFDGDLYDGKGELFYLGTDKKYYKGKLKNGRLDGYGELFDINGKCIKKGKFDYQQIKEERATFFSMYPSYSAEEIFASYFSDEDAMSRFEYIEDGLTC